jgi:hypothetical protein
MPRLRHRMLQPDQKCTEISATRLDYARPDHVRMPPNLALFFMRPIGWPFHLLLAAVGLMSLYAVSVPGGYFSLEIGSIFAWIAIGAIWFCRGIIRYILARYYRINENAGWLRWSIAPAVLVLVFTLAVCEIPWRATFFFSRPAMERFARRVLAQPSGATTAQHVGFYQACNAERIPGGMRFRIDRAGFIDRFGFAYCPDAPPRAAGNDGYEHLSGPWYIWRERF